MKKISRIVHPEFRFGVTRMSDAAELVRRGVGGFCLYGGEPEEIKKTTGELRSLSDHPLIFSADYENGLGQWMKGGTLLPSNMALGACASPEIAALKARISADEARAVGVDWIFAPVVDIACEPDNPIVNIRSFGDSPSLIAELAGSYMEGLNSGGCLSCLKHFPGHGSTDTDSHLALPTISKERHEFENLDIVPYRKLAKKADSVMAGHLKIDSMDPEYPASFSGKIINGLLRKGIGFRACVVTDALSMKAIGDEKKAALLAMRAGADILLVPSDPFSLLDKLEREYSLGRISDADIERALGNQETMARKTAARKMDVPDFSIVNCEEHNRFAREISSKCMAWAFRRKEFVLRRGDEISYTEPLVPFEKAKGRSFIAALEKNGVRVRPFAPGRKLIVGTFSNPRAYSGSINLGKEGREYVSEKLGLCSEAAMVSFGSPFVFYPFYDRLSAGLCAFCDLDSFQESAAGILCGSVEAEGGMPVDLKFAERRLLG